MLAIVIVGCEKTPNKVETRSSDAIKDPIFKKYVMLTFDKNGDYELSEVEMDNVEKLDLRNDGIVSLVGVEIFKNLKHLDCRENLITALDVSKNKKLEVLYCDNNRLTSLDIKVNLSLVELRTFNNEFLDYIVMSKAQNCKVLKDSYTRIHYR